ncbi:PREDICTED: probable serine/threonine-protein kinase abkC isoform X2 [Nelumbo nucifera]|uniref:ABC1 atypical kinase-like domain-containing protein n=2 Tax=Nelumbo nucifera TaxID=4432 RepID=A0A822XK54_NELNU|nr:PREDICTED: probable serine/threonine-protein kinase abkC isoform X2 [Nelumbo nucifera]DAD20750.1 TPA_asm: hypothetical protein HUJ06_022213 [Nelumbo nucifera]
MSRFFAFGNIRRVSHLILTNQRASYSEAKKHGTLVTVGLPSSLCRLYSQYKFSGSGCSQLTLHKAKENLYKSSYYKSFPIISASKTMTNHAQIAWKRLSQICSYSGSAFPPISRFACAMSLALNRSHLVAPSIFAFFIGEVAWTQKAWADTEYFPKGKTLYMHAQDGHVYLTSFIFSLLEGFILLLRSIYLAVLFSPIMAMAPFADCFGVQFRKTWLHLVHLTLEKAGPAFIKWGQWAATRPDLFPRDLCTELSKLQTKAPAHSFAYTKRTIEKAFGRKLTEIFEEFEEAPVASGSIAQVHRASLRFRYPGQQVKPILVAVKVRHPGVGEAIRRDFAIISLVAKISKFIPTLKWLRWRDVSFPKPLYPLVHPAVLVETYEHGESVSHYVDELEGNNRIKSALAHIGTHALLKMLLVDNFIHADMHPGNILVRVSQSKSSRKRLFKSRPHVVFLDVGMTAELSKSDRINLLEFFKAVALRDGRTAAECTLRLSKQQNCPNPKAFIEEVEKSFNFWGTPEGDVVHPAECMQQLLEKVRRHKVNIDGNVCTVMVTTLVLEGWQRKLDPDYNVMHTLQTLLFKADWAQSLFYTIEGLMAP